MTTPTITWQSIDRIADRLLGSDVTGKNYYGDQPCLPADALLAVCRKLSAQTKPTHDNHQPDHTHPALPQDRPRHHALVSPHPLLAVLVVKPAATAIACLLASACAGTSWRATAPQNTPAAWEFNSKMEGWLAFRDGYMRLTAPKGCEWDDLTQSYREVLQ